MNQRTFLRLLVFQSKRKDWGVAVLGEDGNTVVFGYRKTVEAAQALADAIFRQPFRWSKRDGLLTHESDHPGVSLSEATVTYFARLWVEPR
jgi:hypothetical protein